MSVFLVLAATVYATNGQIIPHFGYDRFTFPSSFDIIPSGFTLPRFSDFFGPDWGRKLEEKIVTNIEEASKESGVTRVNGTTIITQTIGGEKYTVEIPQNTSYALSRTTEIINGMTKSTVKLTIDGETAVYTTLNGTTTVTDDRGNPLKDGGFFKVMGTEAGKTVAPDITPLKASNEPGITENIEEQQTTNGTENPNLATVPVSMLDDNVIDSNINKDGTNIVTRA